MADALLAALSVDGALLVRAAVTTELCEEARRGHATSPTATAALGQALTGAILLGSLLKGEQTILLQWRGDGLLGSLVAEGRADLSARGYTAKPRADLPPRDGRADVGGAVGRQGRLVVVKDLGLKEPYRSEVPLQGSELGDDLTRYLIISDQIPSVVCLWVHVAPDGSVGAAGGILVQSLPGGRESGADRVIGDLADRAPIEELLCAGEGPEDFLHRVLPGIACEPRVIGVPRFSCSCGPGRLDAALAVLGPGAAREILATQAAVRLRCAFCATDWQKTAPDSPWERRPPF